MLSLCFRLVVLLLVRKANAQHLGLTVYAPPKVSGQYEVTPYGFGPADYDVDADLAVAASCPCDWLASGFVPKNVSRYALLVVDQLCSGDCLPPTVACAASLANFSALLISSEFNTSDTVTTTGKPVIPLNLTRYAYFQRLVNASNCTYSELPTVQVHTRRA